MGRVRKLYTDDSKFLQQQELPLFHALQDDNHRGDINELAIALEHMRQGCKVYRNMGSTGHIDMIIEFPNGNLMKVDAKQMRYRKKLNGNTRVDYSGRSRTQLQKDLGVQLVAVQDSDVYYVNHRVDKE